MFEVTKKDALGCAEPIHLLRRLEAPPNACGAPRRNQVAACVEYFKLSCIGEPVGSLI
jgi:hypothetical protein